MSFYCMICRKKCFDKTIYGPKLDEDMAELILNLRQNKVDEEAIHHLIEKRKTCAKVRICQWHAPGYRRVTNGPHVRVPQMLLTGLIPGQSTSYEQNGYQEDEVDEDEEDPTHTTGSSTEDLARILGLDLYGEKTENEEEQKEEGCVHDQMQQGPVFQQRQVHQQRELVVTNIKEEEVDDDDDPVIVASTPNFRRPRTPPTETPPPPATNDDPPPEIGRQAVPTRLIKVSRNLTPLPGELFRFNPYLKRARDAGQVPKPGDYLPVRLIRPPAAVTFQQKIHKARGVASDYASLPQPPPPQSPPPQPAPHHAPPISSTVPLQLPTASTEAVLKGSYFLISGERLLSLLSHCHCSPSLACKLLEAPVESFPPVQSQCPCGGVQMWRTLPKDILP